MSDGRSPGNTHAEPPHARLRAGREGAELSRTHISEMTGLSVAVVARIEMRGGTADEVAKYRQALEIALGEVVERASAPEKPKPKPVKGVTQSPAVTGFLGGKHNAVRTTEWNGLKRGDLVKVVGLKGRFKFIFHHTDDRQGEYVELSGPVVRYNERLVGSQSKSVTPDRIIMPRRH